MPYGKRQKTFTYFPRRLSLGDNHANDSKGMAKAVADTRSPAENAAGYVTDEGPVLGFSHMHDSGTGGNPSLGNFPLFVHPGCPEDDFEKCRYSTISRSLPRVPGSADASPGYFRINLTNQVQAEMTTTEHTALYRFTFPGSDVVQVPGDQVADTETTNAVPYSPLILVDLIDLSGSRSAGGIQVYQDEMRIIGEGRFGPSFGVGGYGAFFCADFKGAIPRKSGVFTKDAAREEPKFLSTTGKGAGIPYGSAGAWLQFERPESNSILARVGVSFMSADQACDNAEREIGDFDFMRVEKNARAQWKEKLSAIQVDATGVDHDMQTTFWSGLYRTLLSPQNYTNENPLWNSTEPYYDS